MHVHTREGEHFVGVLQHSSLQVNLQLSSSGVAESVLRVANPPHTSSKSEAATSINPFGMFEIWGYTIRQAVAKQGVHPQETVAFDVNDKCKQD